MGDVERKGGRTEEGRWFPNTYGTKENGRPRRWKRLNETNDSRIAPVTEGVEGLIKNDTERKNRH